VGKDGQKSFPLKKDHFLEGKGGKKGLRKRKRFKSKRAFQKIGIIGQKKKGSNQWRGERSCGATPKLAQARKTKGW